MQISATIIAILLCSTGAALAQGTEGLQGYLPPDFPQIDARSAPGQQGCSFDASTLTLTIRSTPTEYYANANSFEFINAGLLTITAVTDLVGNIQSGTLVVNGTTDSGLPSPLLTGTVGPLGLEDTNAGSGATDRADFLFFRTGGSIPTEDIVASPVTLINSTYAGTLASDWTCDDAQMTIGTTQPVINPDTIEVVIDVKPGSDPNCFNLNGQGVIPVGIDGTSVNVTMVDQETLTFAGLDVSMTGNGGPQCNFDDYNNDGTDDLICQFVDDLSKWTPDQGGTTGTLLGFLFDGTEIFGTDDICLVGNGSSSAINPFMVFLLSLVALMRRRLRAN